ncbi:MAG TPA: leukotoxin LktA family filamentous adhesin, partial [Terriglobales bacterium]|nr:leukotoxin LktA family filamentous adhesin [Terriglobales bacterium]
MRRNSRRRRDLLHLAVVELILVSYLTNLIAAQQIVTDGRTRTSLASDGHVTEVTTGTISGHNAFNSFHKFDVDSGNVVNLRLPDGTSNLINIVRRERTDIHGTLNSIKDGQVGGNVYFANPHGIVVAREGIVNVGALSLSTPTQEFAESLLDGNGAPSTAAVQHLIDGSAPLADGLISVEGTVNAVSDIRMRAGSIANSGAIQSGAFYAGSASNFNDVVNVNGYGSADAIAYENGDIVLFAEQDLRNTGVIASDGASGLNGRTVHVNAGRNIELSGNATISARGHGASSNGGTVVVFAGDTAIRSDRATIDVRGGETSGDGGFGELSANRTVVLTGGGFRAGATNGTAGSALIDPDELTISADDFSDGGNLSYTADVRLTISDGVTISSRNIADSAAGDHLADASEGDSGSISFAAPKIYVGDAVSILAQADNGYLGGDVNFDAVDALDLTWGQGFFQDVTANAVIDIGAATIQGEDVRFNAIASTSKLAELDEDLDENDQNELTYEVDEDSVLNFASFAASVRSESTATITVDGGAVIEANDVLDVIAEAASTANVTTSGRYLGVTYASTTPTAEVDIASGAALTAGGDVQISGTAHGTLSGTVLIPGNGDFANITFGYGKARAISDVRIANGAAVTGANVDIFALNSNEISLSTTGITLENSKGGAGVAVAIGDYQSHATADVAGDIRASGDLIIDATSHNLNNDTRASSSESSQLGDNDKIRGVKSKLGSKPLNAKSDLAEIQIGAAVTVVNSVNQAVAKITDGGDVAADGNLTLSATAEDNFQASAAGTAGEAEIAAGGAVLVADYDNEAYAHIDSGSEVDSGLTLLVDAYAEVPNQITFLDFGREYPDDEAAVEGALDFTNLLRTYLNTNLGLANRVATGYVHSQASSRDDSGGTVVALMADILSIDNEAQAYIGEDAQVNQRADFATSAQSVEVRAEGRIETVEVAGMASILSPFGLGASGGDNGAGGAYHGVTYANRVTAYIDDGAAVSAEEDIIVEALSDNYLVEVGQAGSKTAENGFSGAFSTLGIVSKAIAYIDDEATVDAGDDLSVTADSRTRSYNANGGIAVAKNVGIGVSVSSTNIDTTVQAFLGNADDTIDTGAAGSVDAGDDVHLSGESTYEVFSLSVAGAGAASTGGDSSRYGIGVSGDASVNEIHDQVRVSISDIDVSAGGDVTLDANSASLLVAAGGAFSFHENLGIGGSYAHNIFHRDTEAYTARTTIDSRDLDLSATAHDQVLAVAIGGAGAKKGTSVAGSATINELGSDSNHTTTRAELGEGTTITAARDVNLSSDDELDLI